jgi:hypothetical protein
MLHATMGVGLQSRETKRNWADACKAMRLQSISGKRRRRQKTKTKVLKRERADAEEGARQEDLPTYLPTSLSTYQTYWPAYRIGPADCVIFGGQFCDVAKSGYIIREEI